MPRLTKAQRAAQSAKDARRTKVPISTRLDPEELAAFDARRGESSRSEMVLSLIRDFIRRAPAPRA